MSKIRTNLHKRAASWMLLATSLLALALAAPTLRAADDLSGRWVMAQLTTTVADIPVVGEVYAKTRLVTLHDLNVDGERLHGGGVICRLDIDSGSSVVDMKLSKKFIRSLPKPRVDARVFVHDGLTKLRQKRQWIVVGAELRRPKKDPLPRKPKDKRVRDTDGDGKPGVTIEVDGLVSGKMYVAQRTWTRLSGTKRVDGSFAGKVYFNNEQSVLDATSSMLKDPPDTRPDPSRSFFRLAKLDNDAKCRDARRVAKKWLD